MKITEQQQIEKSKAMATEWFRHHVANVANFPSVTIIHWRRPNTGNYAMRFIVVDNYVIVTGDVGNAIYAFTQPITLDDLQKFDRHYFINKCVASETGRQYTMKIPGISRPVPNIRALAHYIGLQAAISQLATPTETLAAATLAEEHGA